jgi:hypothetical protein
MNGDFYMLKQGIKKVRKSAQTTWAALVCLLDKNWLNNKVNNKSMMPWVPPRKMNPILEDFAK